MPENIAAVMELYPVGERFFQEFTLRQVLLNAAKKRMYGRPPLCKRILRSSGMSRSAAAMYSAFDAAA
jgi:hypothetical protein